MEIFFLSLSFIYFIIIVIQFNRNQFISFSNFSSIIENFLSEIFSIRNFHWLIMKFATEKNIFRCRSNFSMNFFQSSWYFLHSTPDLFPSNFPLLSWLNFEKLIFQGEFQNFFRNFSFENFLSRVIEEKSFTIEC